jgi:ABC-2 type transport system permease protein
VKQLRNAWFIALKDLRLFLTDRMALGFFILFPFLFIVMFNLLLSNVGGGDTRLELHLVTLETSGLSQQIIQSMETRDVSQLKPGDPKIVWDKDYEQAKASVDAGTLSGFLLFPADFTEGVEVGYGTNLEIIANSQNVNTRMALNGLAQGIVSRISAQRVQINAAISLLVEQNLAGGGNISGIGTEIQKIIGPMFQNAGAAPGNQSLITYSSDNVGAAKPMNASSYVVPGYLVMFVFFASALSAEAVIRERRNHTLERLLASSVRKETLLGGIYLGGVLKGLVQVIIFWTFGTLVFHVDMGFAPWAVIVLSILMVLMSSAFSVMLATLAKTERAAGTIGVVVSLVLAPLGGCWWPLFITPQWMQFIAKFTPHGWANSGFDKLLVFGADGSAVTGEMLALAGFAAAFIIIAIINFRTDAGATG